MEPKQQPPYPLRMSPELRARLESDATLARRSLNAEIVDRLERSISGQPELEISGKGMAVALARAEQETALAAVNAEGRLFAAALVSKGLLDTMVELDRRGIKLEMPEELINECYATAYQFILDAKYMDESGGLDAVMDRAERSETQLKEAQAALRAAVKKVGKLPDMPPEHAVKFQRSNVLARRIPVSTKTSRKPQAKP